MHIFHIAQTCPNAKKFKGSFSYKSKYNESWFEKESLKVYKDIVTNSKHGDTYFFCQICNIHVSCSHGGSSGLVRECFPDSKIAQSYACSRTKASCILNSAICLDLKTSVFSLSTDGSNDQNLEKMNPLTVRIFNINQHKVVTKFF